LVFGGLSDNDSWSATAGNIIGGLIPGVGLAADIRDFAAAVDHVANGKEGAWFEMGASIIGFVHGGDIAKGIAKGITKSTAKATAKIGTEVVQEVAKVAKASTAKAVDSVSDLQRGAAKARKGSPRGPPAKRPGNRGHADHRADVEGAGRQQAHDLKRPGEKVKSEKPIEGHTGINRRPDNQVIGQDGRTRVVVESERRPGGKYHQKRVRELEAAGIEVHTRPPSQWGK
jgi:hypothetical protein